MPGIRSGVAPDYERLDGLCRVEARGGYSRVVLLTRECRPDLHPHGHSRSMRRRSRSYAVGPNLVSQNSPLCLVWNLVRFAIGNRGDANQLDLRKRCCARSATIRSTSLERYPERPTLTPCQENRG